MLVQHEHEEITGGPEHLSRPGRRRSGAEMRLTPRCSTPIRICLIRRPAAPPHPRPGPAERLVGRGQQRSGAGQRQHEGPEGPPGQRGQAAEDAGGRLLRAARIACTANPFFPARPGGIAPGSRRRAPLPGSPQRKPLRHLVAQMGPARQQCSDFAASTSRALSEHRSQGDRPTRGRGLDLGVLEMTRVYQ